MKNQKGITLIALVITIIVLLILAGVSIAMLTGKNGILTRASESSEASIVGEIDEAVKLGVAEIVTNQMDPTFNATTSSDGVTDKVTADNVAKAISKNNANLKATPGSSDAQGDGSINVTVAAGTSKDVTVTYDHDGQTSTTNDKYVWTITEEGKITKTQGATE